MNTCDMSSSHKKGLRWKMTSEWVGMFTKTVIYCRSIALKCNNENLWPQKAEEVFWWEIIITKMVGGNGKFTPIFLTFFSGVCNHFSGLWELFYRYISFSYFILCLGLHVSITAARWDRLIGCGQVWSLTIKQGWQVFMGVASCGRKDEAIWDHPANRAENHKFNSTFTSGASHRNRMLSDCEMVPSLGC